MIYWYASKAHYAHHIEHHLRLAPGFDHRRLQSPTHRTGGDSPVMVASRFDSAALAGRPTILIEHGVGQSYLTVDRRSNQLTRLDAGNHPPDPAVIEHWAPNDYAFEPMRDVLPNAHAVIPGAPHLYALAQGRDAAAGLRAEATAPTIAVAVHWNSPIDAPEARGAWPWLSVALRQFLAADVRCNILLCPHPRLGQSIRRHRLLRDARVHVEPHWPTVIAAADIAVADNTSMLWEAAGLGLDVIGVWPPHWRNRKTVPPHGIRFPGPHYLELPYDLETEDEIARHLAAAVARWSRNRLNPPGHRPALQRRTLAALYPLILQTEILAARHLARVDAYS